MVLIISSAEKGRNLEMKLVQYVVDAFTDEVFKGNPAAVIVLKEALEDGLLQKITIENNLSETAFAIKTGENRYNLRWFTPGGEIDLCGHATLGTAYTLMTYYEPEMTEVRFDTLSGELIVSRKDDLFEMDFPAYEMKEVAVTDEMEEVCGARPIAAYLARDLVCVLETPEQVAATPDMSKVKTLPDGLLLHTTAKGSGEYDCVSRSYAPKLGVNEDPVCGSGHCHILPYWFDTLGKDEIVAYQASPRSGVLYCRREGDRIKLAGKAVTFSKDEICF